MRWLVVNEQSWELGIQAGNQEREREQSLIYFVNENKQLR